MSRPNVSQFGSAELRKCGSTLNSSGNWVNTQSAISRSCRSIRLSITALHLLGKGLGTGRGLDLGAMTSASSAALLTLADPPTRPPVLITVTATVRLVIQP